MGMVVDNNDDDDDCMSVGLPAVWEWAECGSVCASARACAFYAKVTTTFSSLYHLLLHTPHATTLACVFMFWFSAYAAAAAVDDGMLCAQQVAVPMLLRCRRSAARDGFWVDRVVAAPPYIYICMNGVLVVAVALGWGEGRLSKEVRKRTAERNEALSSVLARCVAKTRARAGGHAAEFRVYV